MTKKTYNHTQSLKIPKLILLSSKFIAIISPKLATLFIAKLFTTPRKHKIPKRELEMDSKSKQKLIKIPTINKKVVLYQYGESDDKILLVHGWSGRGTQLFKIADELVKVGYSTISFDAPAHGKSSGKIAQMSDFIETILEIERQLGPFRAAVGHSFGGMSLLNVVKNGFKVNNLVIIGSGDVTQDFFNAFISKLNLKPNLNNQLRIHFENKFKKTEIDTTIPVLIIHDKYDVEVPLEAAIHIHKHLKNGELFLTEGLGHRKILGNPEVIEKVVEFIRVK